MMSEDSFTSWIIGIVAFFLILLMFIFPILGGMISDRNQQIKDRDAHIVELEEQNSQLQTIIINQDLKAFMAMILANGLQVKVEVVQP